MIWHKQLLTLFLLLVTIVAFSQPVNEKLFQEKSQLFLTALADSFILPSTKNEIPEKYYWPYVMARLEQYGVKDMAADRYIRLFYNNPPLPYSLVGAIRMIFRYPNCPAIRENMQMMIKNVFDRTDSHNAWTGEGTEEEISMSRTSGYLFAQKALLYGNYFENVPEKLADMKNWILDWSSRIYEVGTAEFNSSANQVYAIEGWLNLYDFAEDEEIRLAARAVLDYYAAEMAMHNSYGLVGGPEMTGTLPSFHEQTASYYLNWLWFSADKQIEFNGNEFVQLAHAVTSDYRPPQILAQYVQSKNDTTEWYQNSKPAYLLDQPSFNKEFYYQTSNYSLGSLVSFYGGWSQPASRMVNWKLIVNNQDTISEVRGNGAYWGNFNGLGRDPWTQWAQHKNILFQLTKMPVNADKLYDGIKKLSKSWDKKWKRDFKKRFNQDRSRSKVYDEPKEVIIDNMSYLSFPNDLRLKEENDVWFIDFGVVYMSIVGIPAYQNTIFKEHENLNVLMMRNDPGKVCGFALEVHEANEFESFESFQSQFIREHIMYVDPETQLVTYESLKGVHLEMLFQDQGIFQEPMVDWGYGIEEAQVLQHLAPYEQPEWPMTFGTGKTPVLLEGGNRYDYNERWPVFSGPTINLDRSVLTIFFKENRYQVDYRNRLPLFSDNP